MKFIKYISIATLMIGSSGIGLTSCEDQPDKFEPTGGRPDVRYIRMASAASADSLIEGAYMESVICLVGNNLRSINKIYFNDQEAVMNTSYLTDHTFIVAVPGGIPEEVTNKIYMINAAGDTTTCDFKVLVPKPVVSSLSNEWATPGQTITINGDFFIDDPNEPLCVTFPGNVKTTEITSVSKTSIDVVVPDNATMEGSVSVTSIYGTGQSSFHYRDTRGMLFDWDGINGLEMGYGWRDGSKILQTGAVEGIEPLDGNYILFNKEEMKNTDWPDEDAVSFNYWPEPASGHSELSTMIASVFDAARWEDYTLKFEVCIPASAPWTGVALNCIFTSNEDVTYATGTNAYIGSDDVPRALWTPWSVTGSYHTDGKWTTISIPLSNFVFSRYAATPSRTLNPNCFTGLTFILYAGSQSSELSSRIYMAIDNIRVVPSN